MTNTNIIIIALAAINILLLFLVIYGFFKYRALFRAYDVFMRGKTAESLEDTIMGIMGELDSIRTEDKDNKEAIRKLNGNQRASFQKLGIVKYNAFNGMGGNLSFAIAILDYTNSGFVFNSVHSREGCFNYIKPVDRGQTDVLLGSEEREALEQALGYVQRKAD